LHVFGRLVGKSEFGGFEPSPSVHHLTITSPISGVAACDRTS
jgi:hypothetical protein